MLEEPAGSAERRWQSDGLWPLAHRAREPASETNLGDRAGVVGLQRRPRTLDEARSKTSGSSDGIMLRRSPVLPPQDPVGISRRVPADRPRDRVVDVCRAIGVFVAVCRAGTRATSSFCCALICAFRLRLVAQDRWSKTGQVTGCRGTTEGRWGTRCQATREPISLMRGSWQEGPQTAPCLLEHRARCMTRA